MSSKLNMSEIFDQISKASTREEKKAVIIKNNNPTLRFVLRAAFHPDIRFVENVVPQYIPNDAPIGLGYGSIDQEINRVYLFEQGNPRAPANLSLQKRQQLLAQLLESLEAREAEVYVNMIKKDLKVPGLDYGLVREIYPDLLLN